MTKIPNWDQFDAVSDSYDDHFRVAREPARALVSFSGVGRDMDVLEFGCGTGFATLLASQAVGAGGSVLATDIAPKMMAVAREKTNARNVEFRIVDGTTPDLPPQSYDVVFANCVLMGFDNVSSVLLRWAALTRPGGVVAFSSFSREWIPPSALVPEALKTLQKYLGEMPTKLPRTDIDTIDACADVLETAGLTNIEVEQHDIGYHYPSFDVLWDEWWGSLFRLRLQALDPSDLASLKSELAASTVDAFVGEGLYRPNVTILAKGSSNH